MRETLNAGTPARLLPLKVQLPVFGLSNPVSRLKNVVLPAPFGPMRAVIDAARDLEVGDVDRGEAAEAAADRVRDDDRVLLLDARNDHVRL